jgi:hypothetical protein
MLGTLLLSFPSILKARAWSRRIVPCLADPTLHFSCTCLPFRTSLSPRRRARSRRGPSWTTSANHHCSDKCRAIKCMKSILSFTYLTSSYQRQALIHGRLTPPESRHSFVVHSIQTNQIGHSMKWSEMDGAQRMVRCLRKCLKWTNYLGYFYIASSTQSYAFEGFLRRQGIDPKTSF